MKAMQEGAAAHSDIKPDPTRLRRCLNPKSIAVIGGTEAARVIKQCRKLNYAGELWAVNPKRKELEGVQCHPDIAALPDAPDAAFVAIPAEASIDAVAELTNRGAGGAVCYASGFAELGEDGAARQDRLTYAAGAMPLIGPNCYGFINLLCGAALWPDYHGASRVSRGAAIFSQSGNVSLNLSMQKRGLPLAWLATLGNQASVGIEEAMAAALEDECITAIGLHIEGLKNLPLFAELAARAARRGVPIIALKSGSSEVGARITMSHTATLAGENALYDALFARVGVGRVNSPEEFIEALKLATVCGAPRGARIASMSCSGGEAALAADLAAGRELEFPPLDAAHRKKVQATLNDYVRADNPLDYHTFIWADRARMAKTFGAMMSGDFDLTMCILDIPSGDHEAEEIWMRAVHAFIDACRASEKPGALVSLLSENMPPHISELLMENNIAPLQGLAQALAAAEAVCAVGRAWARAEPPPALAPLIHNDTTEKETLNEHQAKELLRAAGFSTPKSETADSADAAAAAAARLGFPVAVKALSPDITHKSEAGAVAVGLRDETEVRAHASRMLAFAGRLLIEKMVEDAAAELLLAAGCDRQFGRYFMLGFGGEWVELIGDRQLLLPPLNEDMLHSALARLQTAPLLRGYRGRPRADVAAAVQCALRLQELTDAAPGILEVEINPLMIQSQGAAVADALITRLRANKT
ncbi:MAG: acetate--CoA ligase family protein [Gammaproteobacteria bacterium]|nr:acetate--CoA ligase family protein [Gammaproteobacteria bacterium]